MLSLVKLLSVQAWHSKDIHFAFTAEVGEVSGIQHWLHDSMKRRVAKDMIRSGRPIVALAFDRIGLHHLDRVIIYPEELHAHSPNLDLVNVITTTIYQQGGRAGINPHVPTGEPIDGSLSGLALFSWNTLFSVPRTAASYFSKYEIHAVGISTYTHEPWEQLLLNPLSRTHPLAKPFNFNKKITTSTEHFQAIGNVVAVVLHHIQNLDELLHQSFDTWQLLGAVEFFENQQTKTIIPAALFVVFTMVHLIDIVSTRAGKELGTIMSVSAVYFIIRWFCCIIIYKFPSAVRTFPSIVPTHDSILPVFIAYCALTFLGYVFFLKPFAEWVIFKVYHISKFKQHPLYKSALSIIVAFCM